MHQVGKKKDYHYVESYSKNKFKKLVLLVGFIIRIVAVPFVVSWFKFNPVV